MADINFREIACYCVEQCKQDERRYIETLFFAISNEGDVVMSSTPHILISADCCLLLHSFEQYNPEYRMTFKNIDLQIIHKNGSVSTGQIDKRFYLGHDSYRNLMLNLRENDESFTLIRFSDEYPYQNYENRVKQIWNLYLRVKDLKFSEEIKLSVELFQKDEKILELEKHIEELKYSNHLLQQQIEQYRSL